MEQFFHAQTVDMLFDIYRSLFWEWDGKDVKNSK